MKRLIVCIAILAASWLHAQEVLLPVGYDGGGAVRGTNSKAAKSVRLPFFDDFSHYQGLPDTLLWSSCDAFVNHSLGMLPPTIGVATLDAVDAQGVLHAGASTALFSADTLCSQPIRLDSLFSPQQIRLQPSDSLYLSFYYLPGGGYGEMWERYGDNPEPNDSLMLEFYNPTAEQWERVWATGGWDVAAMADSLTALGKGLGCLWQYVVVPIRKADYFAKNFRFRFRNYCSLDDLPKLGMVGNCDQWHLDYIYLDYHRSRNDRYSRDIAFVEPARSLLKDYQAMPARQFTAAAMATDIAMTITNRYNQQLSAHYSYTVENETGVAVEHYDGGYDNVPSFFPNGNYQTAAAHASPQVQFSYPIAGANKQIFKVVHTVREGVSGDLHPQNDTATFLQVFDNYYAYDDGTAENGYGLSSTSSRVKLAYRFDLTAPDTLTAFDIYFNHTRKEENASMWFHLCVWADNGNGHPGTLLYRDEVRRKPSFGGLNHYCRYVLERQIVVSGTIYIGFEQVTNGYINIGFDRANDARHKVYYLTGSEWQGSILAGALMLRPRFGARGTVGVADTKTCSASLYPTPVSQVLNLEIEALQWQVSLFDAMGRCCLRSHNAHKIDVSALPSGIYLVRIDSNKGCEYQKIIIRH